MSEHNAVIGIDPGMTGGITILNLGITHPYIMNTHFIPKNEISKNKYELNIWQLYLLLNDHKMHDFCQLKTQFKGGRSRKRI